MADGGPGRTSAGQRGRHSSSQAWAPLPAESLDGGLGNQSRDYTKWATLPARPLSKPWFQCPFSENIPRYHCHVIYQLTGSPMLAALSLTFIPHLQFKNIECLLYARYTLGTRIKIVQSFSKCSSWTSLISIIWCMSYLWLPNKSPKTQWPKTAVMICCPCSFCRF